MSIQPVPPDEIPQPDVNMDKPTKERLQEGDLGAKLAAYHKAIEEEFNTVQEAISSGEADKVAETARDLLLSKTGVAARTIAYLAENADSESVRMNCSKYILDNALGEKGMTRPTDPLEKLVNELRGNDGKKSKTSKEVPPPNTETPG